LGVAGANRHDMKMVRDTLDSMVVERPKPTTKKKQTGNPKRISLSCILLAL
jgi:hypothetical protein